jgi:glutamate-ammonia-ligase adenylyltransferase
MRELIDKEKPPSECLGSEAHPGGVVDIEFIAQYLALIAPAKGVAIKVNGTEHRRGVEAARRTG